MIAHLCGIWFQACEGRPSETLCTGCDLLIFFVVVQSESRLACGLTNSKFINVQCSIFCYLKLFFHTGMGTVSSEGGWENEMCPVLQHLNKTREQTIAYACILSTQCSKTWPRYIDFFSLCGHSRAPYVSLCNQEENLMRTSRRSQWNLFSAWSQKQRYNPVKLDISQKFFFFHKFRANPPLSVMNYQCHTFKHCQHSLYTIWQDTVDCGGAFQQTLWHSVNIHMAVQVVI